MLVKILFLTILLQLMFVRVVVVKNVVLVEQILIRAKQSIQLIVVELIIYKPVLKVDIPKV